jgi:hypothetical protein
VVLECCWRRDEWRDERKQKGGSVSGITSAASRT